MKELPIAEKAIAYDEAIKKAKKDLQVCEQDCLVAKQIFRYFPELAESEDERIRKEIINYFAKGKEYLSLCSFSKEEILAWLEKQDPKKHEEELEKAYKTADEVQYKRGYEDAVKDTEKQGEKEPAWGEEDESLRLRTIGALETCKIGSPTKCVDEQINWLKSLKQRIGG